MSRLRLAASTALTVGVVLLLSTGVTFAQSGQYTGPLGGSGAVNRQVGNGGSTTTATGTGALGSTGTVNRQVGAGSATTTATGTGALGGTIQTQRQVDPNGVSGSVSGTTALGRDYECNRTAGRTANGAGSQWGCSGGASGSTTLTRDPNTGRISGSGQVTGRRGRRVTITTD